MNNDYVVLETIATLLNQGYALQQLFTICNYMTKNRIIHQIEKHANDGLPLRDSILKAKIPNNFKEFFYFFSMQKEISEAIKDSLKICNEQSVIFSRIKKQLTYPVFLLVFLFFFSIFVSTFLMPEVQSLFKEFSIESSLFFTVTFSILQILPLVFIILLILFVICITVCWYAVRKQRFAYLDFLILKIPVLSKLLKKYYSMKFAIYYHELLQAGYDTTRIITILTEQMMDTDIKMLVYEIQQEVIQGKDLFSVIHSFDYFEEMLSTYFLMLLENNQNKIALQDYLEMNFNLIKLKINKILKIMIPSIYGFVITFVILVYLCIILPMMDIVNLM